MAHHVQRGTAREAEECAAEMGRLPYSRCSFERVAHAVGELFVSQNVEVEDALIEAYQPLAEARSVSVGLDRVSMPMAEPRPPAAGSAEEGRRQEPDHGGLADGLGRHGHAARPERRRAPHPALWAHGG
jgi:hypothetical protein